VKKQLTSRALAGRLARGFTLIEVMIVVAIIGILAAVAIPAYNDYVRRGQVAEAFSFLSDYRTKMEQYYQDHRSYGSGGKCATDTGAASWNTFPKTVKFFSFDCSTSNSDQEYSVKATGVDGAAVGNEYTINQNGDRATAKFKNHSATATCWLTNSSTC